MKNNTQQINNYLADTKITKGLYLTIDREKIKENLKNFKLKLPINSVNITKRNKISIITLRTTSKKLIQFNLK